MRQFRFVLIELSRGGKMKKLSIVLMILVMSLFFAGCNAIEDLNGEDTSLAQITTDELYGLDVSWSASNLKTKSTVNHPGILPADYYAPQGFTEEMDKDYYQMSCGSASGLSNLVGTRLEAGQSMTIKVNSQIEKGNLEIVLLKRGDDGHEFLHQFETNATESYTFTAEEFGIYYVRAGVESFAGSVEINRSIQQ